MNCGVAPHKRTIDQDAIVSHLAIVGHMGIHHEKIIVADSGCNAFLGSPVNGDPLAEDIVVADDRVGDFPFIFQMLWGLAEAGAGVNGVPFSQGQVAGQAGAAFNLAIFPNFDRAVDNREGSNLHTLADLRFRRNDGGRMNSSSSRYRHGSPKRKSLSGQCKG